MSINDFRLVIKHTRQSHLAMQVSQRLMGTVEGKVRGNDITLSWVSFLEGFQFHLHVWICLLRLDKRSQKEIWFNLIRQVNCLKNHMGCFVLHKQIKTPNPNKMPKSTVFAHFFFLFGTFWCGGFNWMKRYQLAIIKYLVEKKLIKAKVVLISRGLIMGICSCLN